MPIYEYECRHCKKAFEVLVRNSGERPVCPGCHSENPERRLSLTAAPVGSHSRQAESGNPPGTCGRPQCGRGGCQGFGD